MSLICSSIGAVLSLAVVILLFTYWRNLNELTVRQYIVKVSVTFVIIIMEILAENKICTILWTFSFILDLLQLVKLIDYEREKAKQDEESQHD